MRRRFEVHELGFSRPLPAQGATWPRSVVMVELADDDRLNAVTSSGERVDVLRHLLAAAVAAARAAAPPAPRVKTPQCSRCEREFAADVVRSPGRSWCRACEAERVKQARARKAAR